jgi:hypothetical protein
MIGKLFFLFGLLTISASVDAAQRSEIRNGHFYVDGELFYVRGIGYAPWRPHQHPGLSYVDTNRRWTEMDLERIKAAHFNTVRTWDALDPDVLSMAQKNGLFVLQGIRLDPKADFSDPHYQEACISQVKNIAEQSKDFDNVLGYIVMTQPSPEAVVEAGQDATMAFFRRLKRTIQSIDPRPVSMDAWVPVAFLNLHEFDFVTVNLFSFWPKSLNHALGLAGLTRWFVDHYADDRPLLVGETGGYAVSVSSAGKSGGAGGYSEYDQSIKDLESLRATVEGHAGGSVLVSWIDTWYFPRDPDVHDDEPWEWNGVLGIPTDKKKDMDGVPRRIYADVAAYNEVIVLEPRNNHYYNKDQSLPIRAYGAENAVNAEFSLNEGDWKPLEPSGHGWFQGFFKLPKLARRRQQLSVRVLDERGTTLGKTTVSFVTAEFAEELFLQPKPAGKSGRGLKFIANLYDGYHRPIENRKLNFGCFYPVSLQETQGVVTSGPNGEATISCELAPRENDPYLYVAVGTDSPNHVRAGDMRIYRLRP